MVITATVTIAQTLKVNVGNITYLFPASQTGEMTYDNGTSLTIMNKTFALSDISGGFTVCLSQYDSNGGNQRAAEEASREEDIDTDNLPKARVAFVPIRSILIKTRAFSVWIRFFLLSLPSQTNNNVNENHYHNYRHDVCIPDIMGSKRENYRSDVA